MSKDKKYSGKWALDISVSKSDIWTTEEFYDSKDIAIEYGYQMAEREGLSMFRVGLCEDTPNFGIDVDQVIENIKDAMYEEAGEVSEDYLDDITGEDALELEKELNEVFHKWQEKHNYNPSFFKIIAEEVIKL